jgi:hypothetical protein
MHIIIVIVTRNAAISVKTLHTLLTFNKLSFQKKFTNEVVYVNDDAFEKQSVFLKKSKHCDRIIWIDYSIHVDPVSIEKLVDKFIQGYQCLVMPCVTPGIDWDLFKKKITSGSQEPVSQMGLNFDTKVGKSIGENLHIVTETDPKCWAIDTKPLLRALKGAKGEGITVSAKTSEMFKKFIERGVGIYAFTAANLTVTYPHECLGNILESANVSINPPSDS